MTVEEISEMTFWDHIDDLRKVLFRIAAFMVVVSGVFFAYMRELFDYVILAPTRNDFFVYEWMNRMAAKYPLIFPDFCIGEFHVKIININLSSQFFIHMSTSMWLALVVSFPFLIYQIWLFVKPALYDNEKKNAGPAFFYGNLLFFLGVAVGYVMVFPLSLRFLAGYELSTLIENSVSLDSYMDSFLMLCFIMGLVFELPLLSWLLSKIGILHRGFFNKFRKHAVVVLLVLAAVITPSGDPFTLMVVFLPIYMLWEISAMVVKKKPKEVED
ncbi:MAG: twin-arginine translocase subunit TatC [Bacteroidales bacterium]|nr:twin-arginine translocase subunit TatC [Bacteroidales bacterium]